MWRHRNFKTDPSPSPLEEIERFDPNLLLPDQYYGLIRRSSQVQPEKRLWLAVFELAVHDIQQYHISGKSRAKKLSQEAEAWIESEDQSEFFSFDNVCALFGLNPHDLREGLRRWKHSLPKAEDSA